MNKLPILFYRKLKQTPKVFILPMHNSAILELSTKHAFAGITECKSGIDFPDIYYGYLETPLCPADGIDNCELEMTEQCFEDEKQYTKEEVNNILHPIMYTEFNI